MGDWGPWGELEDWSKGAGTWDARSLEQRVGDREGGLGSLGGWGPEALKGLGPGRDKTDGRTDG